MVDSNGVAINQELAKEGMVDMESSDHVDNPQELCSRLSEVSKLQEKATSQHQQLVSVMMKRNNLTRLESLVSQLEEEVMPEGVDGRGQQTS